MLVKEHRGCGRHLLPEVLRTCRSNMALLYGVHVIPHLEELYRLCLDNVLVVETFAFVFLPL